MKEQRLCNYTSWYKDKTSPTQIENTSQDWHFWKDERSWNISITLKLDNLGIYKYISCVHVHVIKFAETNRLYHSISKCKYYLNLFKLFQNSLLETPSMTVSHIWENKRFCKLQDYWTKLEEFVNHHKNNYDTFF